MIRNSFLVLLCVLAGFIGSYFQTQYFSNAAHQKTGVEPSAGLDSPEEGRLVNAKNAQLGEFNLRDASKKATPSVVYIKTYSTVASASSWIDVFFYGQRSEKQRISTGSGVIYSKDGYVITNNHVIEGASDLEVVHEGKSYPAELIGRDPNTDLAVLKVKVSDFPAIEIANSRDIEVGDWVLAVGNPFNLTSTVTAGIVSAKGRHINLVQGTFPLESFIQTDAAINPGNSGGALVNLKGELVGINTAILSNTGSYAGYGFAVPSSIAKKVVEDIISYKSVQKAFLGAETGEVAEAMEQEMGIENLQGAVIYFLDEEGAAQKAGLKKGDIIQSINGNPIKNKPAFMEEMNYYRPGDKIKIVYLREGKAKSAEVTLLNRDGEPKVKPREIYTSKPLGAKMERLSKVEQNRLSVSSGVKLLNVGRGVFSRLGIPDGFIIVRFNGKGMNTPEDVETFLLKHKGRVIVDGIDDNGKRYAFTFYI